MEKYLGILRAIWVHEHGAKIYLSLLERWEKSIAELTKITSLYRVEIYRQLPFLIESGLVIESLKWKRKNYLAASPYKIQEMYTQQQEDVEKHVESLVQNYAHRDKKPKVIYQEWKKALMYVFSDIVNTLSAWDVFYRVSSDDFEDNISLTIYADKIAYIDFSSETSIIIEHRALVDFHKKMFRIMYMSLRK